MKRKSKIIIAILGIIIVLGSILWFFVNSNTVDKNHKEKVNKNIKSEKSSGSGSFQSNIKIISCVVNNELTSILDSKNGTYILKFNEVVPGEFNNLVDGDIFVIEPDERLPEGFAGRFKSKEKDSIIVETPEITEVFKDLEIDTQKSKDLEVVGFVVNGRNISTRGNRDINSRDANMEDVSKEGGVQFNDEIGIDENGQPYIKKLGITINQFKPMDNDFVTLNGEISLEDLVFDLKLGIKDSLVGDYGVNIYTDYTSNVSFDIEANKKIEKDFEIGRLKLRASGVTIGFGENKKKPALGIDIVFMVGVSGEIYLDGELAVINEGYIEVINKLEGLEIENNSNIYGKNYPHKTIKSSEDNIEDKKFKSEASLGVKGGVKAALNIPIKAKIYILRMEICSGTFKNGIEGTIESKGVVTLMSGKEPKLEKECTVEANLDFVSEFELDGGGIKDLLEEIDIELERDMLIEKELLRLNLFNFKYPSKNEVELDENEIELGENSKLDFSKLKEITVIYFDFNDDGTKDKIVGYVNKDLNGSESTETYIVVVDGKNDKVIHVSDVDKQYYYTMDFIGSLDVNGDNKEDIFAKIYAGGNAPDAIIPCYFIYENGKYKLYTDYDRGTFKINVEILDNFKVRTNLLNQEYKEIELDETLKMKYIESGLFTEEGNLLVNNPKVTTYKDGVAFEKNLKGGIDLIVLKRVQWIDTIAGGNPSQAEAGYADVILYITEKYTFTGNSFKLIEVGASATDKDNYNYCKYKTDTKIWSKGYVDSLIMQ